PPRPTLFPYTPLFRSKAADVSVYEPAEFVDRSGIGNIERMPDCIRLDLPRRFLRYARVTAGQDDPKAARRELTRDFMTNSAARTDRKSTRLNSSHLVI